MGMNDELPPTPASLDDVAAYALDAHEPEDGLAIEAHLEAAPGAARWERTLRAAAGELAAVGTVEVPPPAGLGHRVLAEARRRRPSTPVVAGASPIEMHRVELARAVLLFCDLRPADWGRPVDPPEFAGWTVHDVVAHLAAIETLLADHLGVPVDGVPETATDNEGRTAATQARHRDLPPAAAVVELEAAAEAVDRDVVSRGEAGLDDRIDWLGGPAAVRVPLTIRAFESWTHADDVRRALGVPMLPPPRPSLLTMTHSACGFVPGLLAARGAHHPDRWARFRFPDLGPDAAWDADLGMIGHVRPAGGDPVDTELVLDAVDFCRAISARLPRDGVPYAAAGDQGLAAEVVDALPALAML
jgi:uncharacterized protein (TIGR03083 family)